jgi:hypothetical protein
MWILNFIPRFLLLLKSIGGATSLVEHRETREPRPDPSRKLSLGSMMRRDCPKCGEREALFAGTRCCACGTDLMAAPKRGRGRPRGRFNGPLKAPIAEGGDNLLALMSVKPW